MSLGGNLASIHSWQENGTIQVNGAMRAGGDVWIGYFDEILGAQDFEWTDGTCPNDYSSWRDGEPNNHGGEGCTTIDAGGSWNDWGCHNTAYFDCKLPA